MENFDNNNMCKTQHYAKLLCIDILIISRVNHNIIEIPTISMNQLTPSHRGWEAPRCPA